MAMAAADALLYIDPDNWVELPLKAFNQTSAAAGVPRIASSVGETNLDGTFHHTFPVDNGFKKGFTNDNQNYRVVGNYNPVDGNLYSPLTYSTISSPSTYLGTNSRWAAKEKFHSVTWWSVRENLTNVVYEINTAGTLTKHTLPAALSGAGTYITSMCMHKGFLYHAVQNATAGASIQRRATATGVYQDLGGTVTLLGSLRDSLFGINSTSVIYAITNETLASAATYTQLGTIGHTDNVNDLPDRFVSFNGALWLSKHSGLYRFDGVSSVKIFDFSPLFLTVHNGALYFVSDGWLCRFNGSLLERLQYFGAAETIIDLESHANNLYILTLTDTTTVKFGGSSADGTVDNRIFEYDGVNFRVISEIDAVTSISSLNSVGDLLLYSTTSTNSFAPGIIKLDFSNRYKAAAAGHPNPYILTADFDGQLPNINKIIRRLEVDVANMDAADTITIKTQVFKDNVWQTEKTESNLTATSVNYIEFPTTASQSGNVFRSIRVRVTLNTANGSSASLISATIHYTVHPPHRYRFNLTTPITNNLFKKHDATDYQLRIAATTSSHTPMTLQSIFDKFIYSTTNKAFFLSPQRGVLQSLYTAGGLTFTIDGNFYFGGTSIPEPYPLIAMKNSNGSWNIFRIKLISTGGTSTSVTVVANNDFDLTTVSAASGAEVRLCYLVSDFSMVNQTFILDDNTAAIDSDGVSQIERDLVLSFVEI